MLRFLDEVLPVLCKKKKKVILFGRRNDRRAHTHSLPSRPQQTDLGLRKPGGRNSILVSHMGNRGPAACAIFHRLPTYTTGSWIRSRNTGTGSSCLTSTVSTLSRGLTRCASPHRQRHLHLQRLLRSHQDVRQCKKQQCFHVS